MFIRPIIDIVRNAKKSFNLVHLYLVCDLDSTTPNCCMVCDLEFKTTLANLGGGGQGPLAPTV